MPASERNEWYDVTYYAKNLKSQTNGGCICLYK